MSLKRRRWHANKSLAWKTGIRRAATFRKVRIILHTAIKFRWGFRNCWTRINLARSFANDVKLVISSLEQGFIANIRTKLARDQKEGRQADLIETDGDHAIAYGIQRLSCGVVANPPWQRSTCNFLTITVLVSFHPILPPSLIERLARVLVKIVHRL